MPGQAPNPSLMRVYLVRDIGSRSRWVEIGVARPHRDGRGYAIDLDAQPIEGRIVLRASRGSRDEGSGPQGDQDLPSQWGETPGGRPGL
ncbi:hypothetical protein ACETK8_14680 [Brevundimonas staleyi]|uniref:Uncharacterized protein n=1 Tax=Brevundimonas staleyi TaxID=74326 RepID=A0ABW0FW30_9CAUL